MDIFESLENLPVSESCFEDIIGLVEMYLNEEDSYSKAKREHDEAVDRSLAKGEHPYGVEAGPFSTPANPEVISTFRKFAKELTKKQPPEELWRKNIRKVLNKEK